jgi:Protein of unknown function (DUF3500)
MSESIHGSLRAARGRGARSLAMLVALVLVGVSLYASRGELPPALPFSVPAFTTAAEQNGDGKPSPQTARAVAAANAFLESLDAKQRDKALLEFGSAKRAGWSNLPVTMVARNGVRLGDLTKVQRAAAMDAVAAVLSKEGYQKVVDIMDGDQELTTGKGGGKGPKMAFGVDQYFIAFFGKPSTKEPWLLQFGGHHLGLNVTVVGQNFGLTPTHTGAQPTSFMRAGKEVRPLGIENDAAFQLINSLDEKQQPQAMLKDKVKDLLLGPGRDGKEIQPQGIKGSALTDKQQAVLLELIGAWVNMLEGDAATARMAEIKGKLGDTYFAWSGPTAKGSAAYYRVQGPGVVIEYAPQGGTNHIHTVIRDPGNDYGQGLLKR